MTNWTVHFAENQVGRVNLCVYVCVCVCVYIYIYTHIHGEMVDFGETDKMIKISGKMDKSDSYKEFSIDISFFIQEFLQTKFFF